EPLQPEPGADLLVGGGDEDQVARAAPALSREGRYGDRARRHLALHVESAAAPHLAVDELAPERVALPLARVGEADVGGGGARERRAATAPADPRDEVRALGRARVEGALDASRLEMVAQELGGERLVAGRVRRVEPDQLLKERRNLGRQRRVS